MAVFLAVVAMMLSVLAIFINQWTTFFCRSLVLVFIITKKRAQIVVTLVAILLGVGAYVIRPSTGQLMALLIVIHINPLSRLPLPQ